MRYRRCRIYELCTLNLPATASSYYDFVRNGVVWMKWGIWKLEGLRRDIGSFRLCLGQVDVEHTVLSCPEAKNDVKNRVFV
jgi:hypothetical protein